MKGMKVYVLFMGDTYADSNYTVMGDTLATVANPTAPHRLLNTPSYSVLIQHPTAGWILYDTGFADDWQNLPKHILDSVRLEKPETATMTYQLSLLGLKPEDINHVIVSHMHYDHIGNNKLFADTADFYVPKEEASEIFRLVFSSRKPEDYGYYVRDDVLLQVKSMTYMDRDEELFPDMKVIMLPGHCACVMGLLLHLESGTIFFPSDACNERRNYEGQFPGALFDSAAYRESIRRIKYLEKKYHAQVFFPHDKAQLNTMKKCPEYYE